LPEVLWSGRHVAAAGNFGNHRVEGRGFGQFVDGELVFADRTRLLHVGVLRIEGAGGRIWSFRGAEATLVRSVPVAMQMVRNGVNRLKDDWKTKDSNQPQGDMFSCVYQWPA